MTTGKAKPYYATQELHDTLKRIGNGNQSRGLQIAGGFHGRLKSMLREIVETEDDGLFEMLGQDYCVRLNRLLAEIAEAGNDRN